MAKAISILRSTVAVTCFSSQLKAAGITGLTVYFILAVFQPFGTYGYQMRYKMLFLAGYGVICFLTYAGYYALMMSLLRKWFQPQKWTLVRELVTFIPVVLIMPLAALYYHHAVIGGYQIHLNDILYFFKISLTIGLVPFAILFYVKWNNSRLVTLNSSDSPKEECGIVIESNNKKEKPVTAALSALICIKSCGNYVEVTTLTETGTKTVLIRKSLNQLEGKLPEKEFVKVHRSFLVNRSFMESISLKGSSYFIIIRGAGMEIPLSRSMVKTVRGLLEG